MGRVRRSDRHQIARREQSVGSDSSESSDSELEQAPRSSSRGTFPVSVPPMSRDYKASRSGSMKTTGGGGRLYEQLQKISQGKLGNAKAEEPRRREGGRSSFRISLH